MADKTQERRGLGRGLSALMADVKLDDQAPTQDAPSAKAEHYVPVERLSPNPDQPRRQFVEEDLADLTESIREKGIIQPLIVRENPRDSKGYEIVAGERRWRAAQRAKLHQVPVIIRKLNDTEVLEIAIIENIQRADLNAVEEAMGYRQLMDRFGHTQEKMASALGKSRSHIANLLRLLNLPADVLEHLQHGDLSMGHARALITSEKPSQLAKRVIADDLSVRETEKLAKGPIAKPARAQKIKTEKDSDTRALEGDLSANLGMGVTIDHTQGKESGRVTISYKDLDQLDSLLGLLSTSPLGGTR